MTGRSIPTGPWLLDLMRPTSHPYKKIAGKIALVLLWIPIVALILYFTIPLGNIHASQFDTLLVLGCPARRDGTPSPEQRERVMEAVREYKAGVAPVMILSGGPAHNRFVEADVMAKLAESAGVPGRAIFRETHARDTIENIEYSTQIMHAHGWDSVEVISSPSHLRRASLVLMHSPVPVNWRMHAARWPASYGLADKAVRYGWEIYESARMRILGFKETVPALQPVHANAAPAQLALAAVAPRSGKTKRGRNSGCP